MYAHIFEPLFIKPAWVEEKEREGNINGWMKGINKFSSLIIENNFNINVKCNVKNLINEIVLCFILIIFIIVDNNHLSSSIYQRFNLNEDDNFLLKK